MTPAQDVRHLIQLRPWMTDYHGKTQSRGRTGNSDTPFIPFLPSARTILDLCSRSGNFMREARVLITVWDLTLHHAVVVGSFHVLLRFRFIIVGKGPEDMELSKCSKARVSVQGLHDHAVEEAGMLHIAVGGVPRRRHPVLGVTSRINGQEQVRDVQIVGAELYPLATRRARSCAVRSNPRKRSEDRPSDCI